MIFSKQVLFEQVQLKPKALKYGVWETSSVGHKSKCRSQESTTPKICSRPM